MANELKIKNIDKTLKSINFDLWGGFEGFLAATSVGGGGSKVQELRRVVPWLAKATDMTANAVASLPFAIVDSGGKDIDTSADWQDKLGGMPAPDVLFYKLASSLCLGRAYVIPIVTSKQIAELQYCAPQYITAEINQARVDLDKLKHEWLAWVDEWKAWNLPAGEEG